MTKRQITAHKGGRTERLYVRIQPALKAKLQTIISQRNITVADWIEEQIKGVAAIRAAREEREPHS